MATILDLVSVDYSTNAWVDWSDFSVVFWGVIKRKVPYDDHPRWSLQPTSCIWFPSIRGQTGWLEEGSFRWPAPPLIQDGCHFGFLVYVDFLTNAWVDWSDFLVAHWGVTGGRFLSMISSATHPRWSPSWICFPLIF
jgi:hypothetical protein